MYTDISVPVPAPGQFWINERKPGEPVRAEVVRVENGFARVAFLDTEWAHDGARLTWLAVHVLSMRYRFLYASVGDAHAEAIAENEAAR